jgi:TonB family protein
MSKDYLISLLIHLGLFAIIVIFSASSGRAKLPKPGEFVNVGLVDRIRSPMPALQQPSSAFDDGGFEPEPVKLAAKTEKIKIKKPEPKPKPKETKKESEKKSQQQTKPKPAEETQSNAPQDGAGLEIGSENGEFAEGNFANGPLGEYYLAYDFSYVISKIKRNWSNPVTSNAEIACVIYFQITKDGSIQGAVVEKSSGNRFFDDYARQAVAATGKLPSLPLDFPDNEVLTVHLTFRHRP